jgi:hypothetical protein
MMKQTKTHRQTHIYRQTDRPNTPAGTCAELAHYQELEGNKKAHRHRQIEWLEDGHALSGINRMYAFCPDLDRQCPPNRR